MRSQLKPLQEIPFVNRVPVVATLSENKMLATTERLSRSIVETTSGAQKIIDDVETELPSQDFDLLPEALRLMRRLGTTMRPEMRAIWEPAVVTAREMLTPEELRTCIEFLARTLEMVSAGSAIEATAETTPETTPASASKDGRR